jgi:hypothetical protein
MKAVKKRRQEHMRNYDETQKEGQPASQSFFQEHGSPERPRRGGTILLIILAAVVILGAGGFMLWQASSHASMPSPITTKSTQEAGSPTSASGSGKGPGGTPQALATLPGQNDPPIYWQTIQAQFAQGIHLSVAQTQQDLQNANVQAKSQHETDPGAAVDTVAQQQGISTAQLRQIEIGAIQQACAQLVRQGTMTQQQADQRVQTAQSWDQSMLNQYILHAFVGG